MGGKQQLSLHEVEVSKSPYACRASNRSPKETNTRNSPTNHKHDSQDYANIDRILTVCAAHCQLITTSCFNFRILSKLIGPYIHFS